MPSIAVIGASADRSKFGNKCVRAYSRRGYEVYPVHPREHTIEGLPVFRSIRDVPIPRLDRVSIYLPPAACLTILEDLTQKAIGEVWFNPGADAPEVLALAREMGLPVVAGCSILAAGISPSELSDE